MSSAEASSTTSTWTFGATASTSTPPTPPTAPRCRREHHQDIGIEFHRVAPSYPAGAGGDVRRVTLIGRCASGMEGRAGPVPGRRRGGPVAARRPVARRGAQAVQIQSSSTALMSTSDTSNGLRYRVVPNVMATEKTRSRPTASRGRIGTCRRRRMTRPPTDGPAGRSTWPARPGPSGGAGSRRGVQLHLLEWDGTTRTPAPAGPARRKDPVLVRPHEVQRVLWASAPCTDSSTWGDGRRGQGAPEGPVPLERARCRWCRSWPRPGSRPARN